MYFMIRNIFLAASAALLLTFTACKKADKTPPIINSVMVNGQQHDFSATAGDTLQVEIKVSDDKELGQLKVAIHEAFDGHGHGKIATYSYFDYVKVENLEGADATVTLEIAIPEMSLAGPYHFIVQVVDAEGNEAEEVELTMILQNTGMAVITVTHPDFSGPNTHFDKGSTIDLQGNVTDDVDIKKIVIIIEAEDGNHGKVNQGELVEIVIDLSGSVVSYFDFASLPGMGHPIEIPLTADDGDYEFLIIVTDSDGNMTIWEAEIHID